MTSPFDAQEVLRAIAVPRLVGSEGWLRVRDELRRRFTGLGYEAEILPFAFSPVPGRYAVPVAGALLIACAFLCGAFLSSGMPGGALAAIVLAGTGIALVALLYPFASTRLRWSRLRGQNLLFRRPGARPRWILMAHYDSKSQLVPLLLRGPAGFIAGAAWLVLFLHAVLAHFGPPSGAVPFVAATAMLAGTAFLLSRADDASPGALDNASGVATLIGVASRDEGDDVAYLFTDAEELGLLGSRAALRMLPPVEGVINVDGIDDDGTFFVFERFGIPRHGFAPGLRAALLAAAQRQHREITRKDVPLGILLDHMPLARAGLPSLTLLRGSLRSLARVHRPGDDLAHLRGTGITGAVALLHAALGQLRAGTRQGGAAHVTRLD